MTMRLQLTTRARMWCGIANALAVLVALMAGDAPLAWAFACCAVAWIVASKARR